MQFTCVDVWGDGRKEVWPGDAFWVMTLWVGRMTLRPWWEAGGWCIKTAITASLGCKQMYCCTLGPPEAEFVLDVSLICQAQSVKCNSPRSCIRAFLWLWLRFGWFGEYIRCTHHHYRLQVLTPSFFFPDRGQEDEKSDPDVGMTIIPTLWLNLDLAEFISWLCNLWHTDNPLSLHQLQFLLICQTSRTKQELLFKSSRVRRIIIYRSNSLHLNEYSRR